MLAGGVFGTATNFDAALEAVWSLGKNSSGSPPASGRWQIAGSAILLTDDVDETTLSSTQTPWIELTLTLSQVFKESWSRGDWRSRSTLWTSALGFQYLLQDLWWDSVAQLMLSFASFRSVIRELFADFVMSCIHGIWRILRFWKFFALSLWPRTSRRSSASLCWSRSISGPAADWAARDSSSISRCCCVSWTNPVKCWCCPAYAWLCCCVTSAECEAWRLSSVCTSCTCASRFHASEVTSVTKISFIFKSLIRFLRKSR